MSTASKAACERREISDLICREVTPGMISAALDVLEESTKSLNSGELFGP